MRRSAKTYMRWLILLAVGTHLWACADAEGDGAAVPMGINLLADGEEGEENCRLLLWDEETFDEWMNGTGTPAPTLTCAPERPINDYNHADGIAYNTGEMYPADGSYLYATGYAPAAALSPNGNDHGTLTVNESHRDGQTDFLSCDGDKDAHKGSVSDPFTKEEHELVFRHLTTRIRFVGIRNEVMYNKIGVDNVKVTLCEKNGLFVPERFEKKVNADKTKSTYVAATTENARAFTVESGGEMIPATAEGRTLGSCHVLHGPSLTGYDPFGTVDGEASTTLSLDIEADLYYLSGDTSEPTFYTRKRWTNVKATIQTTTNGLLLPGYEYVVRIIFNNESITLQGLQKGWEDGGIHYVPVRLGSGKAGTQ